MEVDLKRVEEILLKHEEVVVAAGLAAVKFKKEKVCEDEIIGTFAFVVGARTQRGEGPTSPDSMSDPAYSDKVLGYMKEFSGEIQAYLVEFLVLEKFAGIETAAQMMCATGAYVASQHDEVLLNAPRTD